MVVEVEHPTAGAIRNVGIPVKFSETPGSIRRPPPRFAEHTEEVLRRVRVLVGRNRLAQKPGHRQDASGRVRRSGEEAHVAVHRFRAELYAVGVNRCVDVPPEVSE